MAHDKLRNFYESLFKPSYWVFITTTRPTEKINQVPVGGISVLGPEVLLNSSTLQNTSWQAQEDLLQ